MLLDGCYYQFQLIFTLETNGNYSYSNIIIAGAPDPDSMLPLIEKIKLGVEHNLEEEMKKDKCSGQFELFSFEQFQEMVKGENFPFPVFPSRKSTYGKNYIDYDFSLDAIPF